MRNGAVSLQEWPTLSRPDLSRPLIDELNRKPGRSQLLRGPSGIGKTTLAAQIGEALGRSGRKIVPVVALEELAHVSLAALAPVLNTRVLANNADENAADRVQSFLGLMAEAPENYVLIVDDAPLLDPLSAAVIYQAIRVYGISALLLARDEHGLDGPIARLLHEDLVTVTELETLSRSDVAELVERCVGASLHPETALSLYEASTGNPLFLRELVFAAHRSGSIRESRYGVEIDAVALPVRLLDTVRDRLASLASDELHLAKLLALSQPWPAALAREAYQEPFERMRLKNMVVFDAESRARLGHPLFAEALLADLEAQERGDLVREAATMLRGTGLPSERFASVRLLSDHPGLADAPSDAEELEWAAGFAAGLGDSATALQLARAAAHSQPRFRSSLIAASALSALGEAAAADAEFELALALAGSDGERELVALRWGQHTAYRRRDPRAAIVRSDTISARIAHGTAVALAAETAKWRMMAEGDPGAPSLEPATGQHEPFAHLSTSLIGAMLATMRGDSAQARGIIAAARPLAEHVEHDYPHAAELLNLSEALSAIADGDIAEARTIAERGRMTGSPEAAGQWSYVLALMEYQAGRLDLAHPLAQLAAKQLAWRDFTGLGDAATAFLAVTTALSGRVGEAAALLDGISSEARADAKVDLHVAEASAWLAIADGRDEEAAEALRGAVARALEAGQQLLGALTIATALRLSCAGQLRSLAGEATLSSPSLLVAAVAKAADAAAVEDPLALLASVPDLRRAGLAAAARRLVQGVLSSAHLEGEARHRAQRFASELDRETLEDEVLRAGGQGRGGLIVAMLTPRELEIAHAAAGRLRSREIAARLGISERTVDNHLAKVYGKLGISTRDELARIFDG